MQTASIHPNVNAIEKVEPLPLFHFWVGLSIKKAHIENIRNLSFLDGNNVIKDDNYAGEIVNKGALNIAFSRLNLHTQLIFVLATILTFQIINRTLKSLKLLKTLKNSQIYELVIRQ